MRIYLDVCCLNRPFDDQAQDRIRLESEAVLLILNHFETNMWQWISSEVVSLEVSQTPDEERRFRMQVLEKFSHYTVPITATDVARAQELTKIGFHTIDALHLACAESAAADIFLTTDDRLLRLVSRFTSNIQIEVENPLTWLAKVSQNDNST